MTTTGTVSIGNGSAPEAFAAHRSDLADAYDADAARRYEDGIPDDELCGGEHIDFYAERERELRAAVMGS